jgi:predicted CopG family antitoxin
LEGGKGVPREGYRTICVTDDVYNYLQKNAKETNRTIPEYIKHLIEKNNTTKEEE